MVKKDIQSHVLLHGKYKIGQKAKSILPSIISPFSYKEVLACEILFLGFQFFFFGPKFSHSSHPRILSWDRTRGGTSSFGVALETETVVEYLWV